MSIGTANYRNADALAGGELAAELAHHVERGHSLRRIASDLLEQHGIHCTPTTVASWCDRLGLDRRKQPAAT